MNTPSRPRFAAAAILALAVLLSLPVFAAEPAPTKNYVGMNTYFARDWDGIFPWADVMHFSKRWITPTNATGVPQRDFTAVFTIPAKLVNGVYTPGYWINDTYNLKFTGQATLSLPAEEVGRVTITNQAWDSNPLSPTYNTTTATVTINYPYDLHAPITVEVNLTNTKQLPADAPGNGVAGISLFKTTSGTFCTLNNVYTLTDADEWPTSDARAFVYSNASLPLGVYKLQFTGQATIADAKNGPTDTETYFTVSNQVYNSTTHTTTADLTVVQPATQLPTINILFTDTHRFNGTTLLGVNTGITNVRLWRPGYTVAVNAPISATTTPMFATEYKTIMGKAQAIRFMDWCDVNSNPIRLWADRTRVSDASWARADRVLNDHGGDLGVPYEVMVRLCNELNADLYINIPAFADFGDANQTYVKNLAKLIKYGSDGVNPYASTQTSPVWAPLNPNLKVYIEYGNETWNAGGAFFCYRWTLKITDDILADTATTHPIEFDGQTSRFVIHNRYIAYRTSQIAEAFRSIFPTEMMTRVRPVFMGQKGDPLPGGQLTDGLKFLDQFYGTIHALNSTVRPVSDFLYGGGGSAYYHVINSDPDPNIFFATTNWPEPGFGPAIQNDAVWMGNYGLKRLAYEGGIELGSKVALTNPQSLVLNADPRMRDVVNGYHNVWSANGGDLLLYYTCRGPAAWEFTPTYNQFDSPKLLAVDDIRTAANRTPSTAGAVVHGTNTTPVTGTLIFRDTTTQTIGSKLFTKATDTATGEDVFSGYTEGNWLAFAVSSPSANSYKCSIRYKLTGTVSTDLDILVNGVLATTVTVAGTNAVMADTPQFDLTLPEGFTVVRIQRKIGSGGSATMSMRSATFTLPDVTTNLIGRWKFDGNAQDSSGTGKNGTVTGSPTYTSTGVPVGVQAINLSGTGQYVTLTGYNGITGTAARTTSAWVKTTASGTIRPIIAWGTTATGSKWVVTVDATGHFRVEISSGSITSSATINDGQWHHVAVTFANDGTPNIGDAKLYVDSVLDTAPTIVAGALNTVAGTAVQIGRDQSSRLWNGALDDVRLYDRALTAAEIEAVYYQAQ